LFSVSMSTNLKPIARILSAMIIASSLRSSFEIFFIFTVRQRDRFYYNTCFKDRKSQVDPYAPMKHAKNTKLRIQFAHLETTLEIVFTVMSAAFIAHLNVSSMVDPEFGKAPSGGDLVLGVAIQYVMEMGVDFVCIAYLTCIANQAYLEYAQLHHEKYTVTMGFVVFFSSMYLLNNSIPSVLYRIPPISGNATCQTATCGHESEWVWIMPCVQDSNSTFNACL